VAYLAELRKSERNGWAQLGRRPDAKQRPAPTLFDPPAYPEPDEGGLDEFCEFIPNRRSGSTIRCSRTSFRFSNSATCCLKAAFSASKSFIWASWSTLE
jgi:hypothetical protein